MASGKDRKTGRCISDAAIRLGRSTNITNNIKIMRLGYPQMIVLNQFDDCLNRTKKKGKALFRDSYSLVREVLINSSVVEFNTERSFSKVCTAIGTINKFLCPGIWCCRSHCKNYSGHNAYNCKKTRPAVCEDYYEYRRKQIKKRINFYESDDAKNKLYWLLDEIHDLFTKVDTRRFKIKIKENLCGGIYFIEESKSYIAFENNDKMFFIGEYKQKTEAIESFFLLERRFDREIITKILRNKEKDN